MGESINHEGGFVDYAIQNFRVAGRGWVASEDTQQARGVVVTLAFSSLESSDQVDALSGSVLKTGAHGKCQFCYLQALSLVLRSLYRT
jgi:hypothetical protein